MFFLLLLAALIWYIVGLISFRFWWLKQFPIGPVTSFQFIAAWIGPIAYFEGYCLHGVEKDLDFFGQPKK